ncbi:egg-1 [Pristionchus pacificus]|uniref:Egg-1 n=1 Tax=Pristionchus pacificus TaxID=54126 RepID=A0A2A6CYU4_PRIPA|nr:egg-1 [Pristionchus pacificus]|eukprot:PDM83382.1 egg-1 [Pristionchus pacificus]
MAHPIEPSFGRHGNYSTGAVEAFRQGSFTTPTNMYHVHAGRQEPRTFMQKVTMRADSIRDALGDKCCRCLHHVSRGLARGAPRTSMPSLVLIIGILLLIGLAIAAVPVAFILISNAGQTAELKGAGGEAIPEGTGAFFHPIRDGLSHWPGYEEDAEDGSSKKDGKARPIPSTALFPPNVSLCHGFGFACTSQPSMVISTSSRCDGKADCPDASDEANCRECQTPFWCEKLGAGASKARERLCLRGEQLCDGVIDCPDKVDETTFCRKSQLQCPTDTTMCEGSPLCLPNDSRCDGVQDCRGGDDEQGCKECTKGAKMCSVTGRCISRADQCDGVVQCPDGSDEADCECKACSGTTVALCSNGRCLERSRVCDGTIDCEDGDDEKDCPGTCRAPLAGSAPSASSSLPSSVKTVKCADGRHYPEHEACSGMRLECARSCPICDAKLAFRCGDGKCLSKMKVCDGNADCAGAEDEAGCADNCSRADHFKCVSSDKCVPKEARCDGVEDCEDASDEKDCKKCPSDALHCPSDNRCFPSVARCDGTPDCTDASDETDCTCQECTGAHSDTYSCGSTNHCFKRDAVCGPFSKCPNATESDRLFCAAKALQKNLF